MASKVLMKISKDEVERARLMSELKYELDMQSKLVHAEEKGIRKGRKEGRAEGRAEGQAENRAEILKIARKLKNMGLSSKQIKAATGL